MVVDVWHPTTAIAMEDLICSWEKISNPHLSEWLTESYCLQNAYNLSEPQKPMISRMNDVLFCEIDKDVYMRRSVFSSRNQNKLGTTEWLETDDRMSQSLISRSGRFLFCETNKDVY